MIRISHVGVLTGLMLILLGSLSTANAYVGPGPGLTVIGALWAVIAAILLAIIAIVKWPLRYFIRKLRKNDTRHVKEDAEEKSETK